MTKGNIPAMALSSSPKAPEAVFTPREPTVTGMYVARPELEERLKQALRGTQHIVIHGESGTGKSWLYKKVLRDLGATLVMANLANASRLGSITAEIKNNVDRLAPVNKTGYMEAKHATVKAVVADGGLSHAGSYTIGQKEPFEASLEGLRAKAGGGVACMVFDNLEAIIELPDRMKELADVIILLDDERYATYKVKILIVGVPARLRDYFNQTPARMAVANRLEELPEVSRLTSAQTSDLVTRGFIDELGYAVPESVLNSTIQHVAWVTDRIPQRIHEYCLESRSHWGEGGARAEEGHAEDCGRRVADGVPLECVLGHRKSHERAGDKGWKEKPSSLCAGNDQERRTPPNGCRRRRPTGVREFHNGKNSQHQR